MVYFGFLHQTVVICYKAYAKCAVSIVSVTELVQADDKWYSGRDVSIMYGVSVSGQSELCKGRTGDWIALSHWEMIFPMKSQHNVSGRGRTDNHPRNHTASLLLGLQVSHTFLFFVEPRSCSNRLRLLLWDGVGPSASSWLEDPGVLRKSLCLLASVVRVSRRKGASPTTWTSICVVRKSCPHDS